MGFAAIYNVLYVLCLTKMINIIYQIAEITSYASFYVATGTERMFKYQKVPLVISV